jgi:hypothetical protein
MLFAILNAGLIYGVIWIFERQRREIYDFDFGKIAVIPPFIYLGLSVLVLVLGVDTWGSWAALAGFLIALFWMLWRNANLSIARASSYSLIVLVLNVLLMTLLTYKRS